MCKFTFVPLLGMLNLSQMHSIWLVTSIAASVLLTVVVSFIDGSFASKAQLFLDLYCFRLVVRSLLTCLFLVNRRSCTLCILQGNFNILYEPSILNMKPPKSTGREQFGEAFVTGLLNRFKSIVKKIYWQLSRCLQQVQLFIIIRIYFSVL